MKRIITVSSLIAITIIGLFLVNQVQLLAKPSDTMSTANQLYETGQYSQAAQAYQSQKRQAESSSDPCLIDRKE